MTKSSARLTPEAVLRQIWTESLSDSDSLRKGASGVMFTPAMVRRVALAIRKDAEGNYILLCPPSCRNGSGGTCPECFKASGAGCGHGPLCDECAAQEA